MEGNSNRQILFSMIGIAILVVGLVGVTYAFFNYTKTGATNIIRVGRMSFSATEGDTVSLSNLFPISVSGEVTPETPGVGNLYIHITGDTNYTSGIEYLVTAVNVTSSGGSNLPISVKIGYEASNEKEIGEPDDNYFTNRGGTESLYKILSSDTIGEGQQLVVGYIAPGEDGIDGNIIISAYLDASNIAITDTYPSVTYYEVNDSLSNSELSECVSYLSSLNATEAFCNGTGTVSYNSEDITFQNALDNGVITTNQKEHLASENIIYEIYTDGTDSNWVDGRNVFTTAEWNELQSNGISFQIKVEANEGIWVTTP